ncbi:threonylcarbamoyl-AMP synthase [Candidatus Nomurabacteria bacterium]|nr:threonylcarbamoyl-AMP synthase [Candidatus Nomurabacteria bacterium]
MQVIQEENVDIPGIARQIAGGATLVFPTETCYCLGSDATSTDAVEKIFEIKKKQKTKSVLVVMKDQEMARDYVAWTPQIDTLAQMYWPGPLSIVAKALPDISLPEGVLARDGTIAFRISKHPFVQKLMEHLQVPLVATSANIFGGKSAYSIVDVKAQFEQEVKKPDIMIDGGVLPEKLPSTIVKVTPDVHILRQGEIIIPEIVI